MYANPGYYQQVASMAQSTVQQQQQNQQQQRQPEQGVLGGAGYNAFPQQYQAPHSNTQPQYAQQHIAQPGTVPQSYAYSANASSSGMPMMPSVPVPAVNAAHLSNPAVPQQAGYGYGLPQVQSPPHNSAAPTIANMPVQGLPAAGIAPQGAQYPQQAQLAHHQAQSYTPAPVQSYPQQYPQEAAHNVSAPPPGSSPFGAVIRRGAAPAAPVAQVASQFEPPRSDYSDLDKSSMDFRYARKY